MAAGNIAPTSSPTSEGAPKPRQVRQALLVLGGAIGLALLLTWPWLLIEARRAADAGDGIQNSVQRAASDWLEFGQPILGCLLFGAIGALLRRRMVPVLAVVLTVALGWWIGDQFEWVSGSIRGARGSSGGSGFYPETWAAIALVEAAIGSSIGWFLGRLVARLFHMTGGRRPGAPANVRG